MRLGKTEILHIVKQELLRRQEERLSEDSTSIFDTDYRLDDIEDDDMDMEKLLSQNFNEVIDILVDKGFADSSVRYMSEEEIMSMQFVDGKLLSEEDAQEFLGEEDTQSLDEMQSLSEAIDEASEESDTEDIPGEEEFEDVDIDETEPIEDTVKGESIDSETAVDKPTDTKTEETSPKGNVKIYSNGKYIEKEIISLTKEQIDAYDNSAKLLEDMYSDEDVIAVVDEDGDGKISDEEMEKFEYYLMDGKDRLTLDDLKDAVKQIKDDKFDTEKYKKFEAKPEKTIDTEKPSEYDAREALGLDGATGNPLSSGGGGSSSGGSYNGSGSVKRDPTDINQMTLDELKAEKTKRQQKTDDAQKALEGVYNGENKAVKSADEALEKAEKEYEEALNNEDEGIKAEVKELEEERKQALVDIQTKQKEIDETNGKIVQKQGELSQVTSEIASVEANIQGLKQALESYPDNPDPKEQAEVEAAKAQIQAQIDQLEAQKEKLEEQKTKIEEEISTLNESLTNMQTNLDELNKNYDDISEKLEKALEKASKETQEKLKAVKDAKDNVQDVRKQETSTLKTNLENAQKDLDAVNKKINEKQASKAKSENSYTCPDKAVNVLEELMNNGANQAELRKLFNAAGIDFHEGLYCGETAYYALVTALGEENLPDWLKTPDNGATGCHYQSAGGLYSAARHGNAVVDFNQAQPGDILIADDEGFSNPWAADHVMMVKEVYPDGRILIIEGNGPGRPVDTRVVNYSSVNHRILSTHVK